MLSPPGRAILTLAVVSSFLLPTAHAQIGRQIAQNSFPSVVLLVMQDANRHTTSFGSGFFVRDGIVATNLHVVEGAAGGYVKLVGQSRKYDILGIVSADRAQDLVLLAVPGTAAPSLPLGDSRQVAVGDEIFVVGNPQGLEGTFSQGIVSGVRQISSQTLMQITAPMSPGSSGGPVLNMQGKVIGVAMATFKGGQNLNFAVPTSYLSTLLSNMKPVRPLAAEARPKQHQANRFKPPSTRRSPSANASAAEPHLLACIEMIYKKLYAEAEQECRVAIRLDAGNAVAHTWLAEAYSREQKWGSAIAEYREALEIRPNESDVHCSLGIALEEKGDFALAFNEWRTGLGVRPEQTAACWLLAARLKTKRLSEVISVYVQIVRSRPDLAAAHANLADALKDEYTEEAYKTSDAKRRDLNAVIINEYRAALRLNADLPEVHESLGDALKDSLEFKYDPDAAMAEYREALRLDPDRPFAHHGLAEVLEKEEDLDAAIVEYREAGRLDPKLVVSDKIAELLQKDGKIDEAIVEYREIMRRRPSDSKAYYRLGDALKKKGQLEDALTEYRAALNLKHQTSDVLSTDPAGGHVKVGDILLMKGDLEGAMTEYRAALSVRPVYVFAHYKLSVVLNKIGRSEEAAVEYKKAFPWTQTAFASLTTLAVYRANSDDAQGAVAKLREALGLEPDNSEVRGLLLFVLENLGDVQGVIAEQREMVRLRPQDPKLRYRLGRKLERIGGPQAALEQYRKAYELQPDNSTYRNAYEHLSGEFKSSGP